MRIIICGYGIIGKYLVTNFSALNLSITLIENDKNKIEEAKEKHDAFVIQGEILSHQILDFANAGNSDLFIACTDSDSLNITACQLVKKMGCKHVIARIYNNELFPINSRNTNISQLEKYFNINRLLSPSRLASYQLANIISNEKGSIFKPTF